MLQEKDIVKGTKVRCLRYGLDFGKVGTIYDVIGSFFYVRDNKNQQIGEGWTNTIAERDYFDLEDDATVSRSHPMGHSDRKVGTKVVCVYTDNLATGLGQLYGMVGTIKRMDGGLYHVQASNGESIGDEGWSENSSFNVVVEKPTTRPMLAEDKRVGTRVICVYDVSTPSFSTRSFGRVGNITQITSHGGYVVVDDDGVQIGTVPWTRLSSFEVVLNSPIKTMPKETVGDIVVESVTVKAGPCPAYYYGIQACTCGKCSSGGALRFH